MDFTSPKLTRLSSGGGCGCKIAPAALRDILAGAGGNFPAPPQLLRDAQSADDAAAWRAANDLAVLATADFFPPVVDDPADFGKIAAANALSDIYAMGGTPLFALALVAAPASLAAGDVSAILRGGADMCAQAEVPVAGGHSIAAAEPLYGLAVVGRAHPKRLMTNGGAKPGDVLILGKPLGVGVLAAALQKDSLPPEGYSQMLSQTTLLNKAGPALAATDGAHAMTDVTGFGLLGHLLEMCRASDCAARIDFARLPLLDAAVVLAKDGIAAGASGRNWKSYGGEVLLPSEMAEWRRVLLTDPQTSGGLLLSCAGEVAESALAVFREHGCAQAAVIGEMRKEEEGKTTVEIA